MVEQIKKLTIKNVLMDVDGTMTVVKKSRKSVPPLELLIDLLVEERNISREAALKSVNDAGDINITCLFDLLDKLEVSKDAYWNLIKNDLRKIISIPDDTVSFIRDLKNKRIKLFSATTNSRMMTLLKMSLGGLASIEGSPYIAGFFAGNTFKDPAGKYSENFFPSIMRYSKFNPATTMMIGDDIELDLKPAFKAGIKNVVIINRNQPEPLLYKKNAFFVNSLRTISNIL